MRLHLVIILLSASVLIQYWHRTPASDAMTKENADLRAQVREGDAKLAEAQGEIVELTRLNWVRRQERDATRAATRATN